MTYNQIVCAYAFANTTSAETERCQSFVKFDGGNDEKNAVREKWFP